MDSFHKSRVVPFAFSHQIQRLDKNGAPDTAARLLWTLFKGACLCLSAHDNVGQTKSASEDNETSVRLWTMSMTKRMDVSGLRDPLLATGIMDKWAWSPSKGRAARTQPHANKTVFCRGRRLAALRKQGTGCLLSRVNYRLRKWAHWQPFHDHKEDAQLGESAPYLAPGSDLGLAI